MFSGFLVCDIHGDLIPTDDLPDALLHCYLIDKADNPRFGSFGFYLFFGMFPRLPCLPIRCGQDRVMDIFTRPTRPIKDKQFLKPPSKVTRPEVPTGDILIGATVAKDLPTCGIPPFACG